MTGRNVDAPGEVTATAVLSRGSGVGAAVEQPPVDAVRDGGTVPAAKPRPRYIDNEPGLTHEQWCPVWASNDVEVCTCPETFTDDEPIPFVVGTRFACDDDYEAV